MTKVLLWSLVVALMNSSTVEAAHEVPLFTTHNLSSASTSHELLHVLSTTGLLALSLPSFDQNVRTNALKGLCQCTTDPDFARLDGTDSITLNDGSTVRQSFATATVGTSPLPLGDDLAGTCGQETVQAMDALRGEVAEASRVFLEALDGLVGDSRPILGNSYGGSYQSVSSVVQAASNLEHFHVYTKKESASNSIQPALRVHTDAGLFLAFVPAMDCAGDSDDRSFYVKDAQGILQQAIFPRNSVAIMLGAGAQHWLATSDISLKSTQHSVQMEAGARRAWYGLMSLVPESAVVDESSQTTFGEMRQGMILKSQSRMTRTFGDDPLNQEAEDAFIGCGFSDIEDLEDSSLVSAPARHRRRLQHVENAGACNNVTNFYCWMSCLDIPEHDQAEEGYSLYCADESVMNSTESVSDAQEPCIKDGVLGLAMNTNCTGMWEPTAAGAVAQEVKTEGDDDEDEDSAPSSFVPTMGLLVVLTVTVFAQTML